LSAGERPAGADLLGSVGTEISRHVSLTIHQALLTARRQSDDDHYFS
jgi:hypothetical protein